MNKPIQPTLEILLDELLRLCEAACEQVREEGGRLPNLQNDAGRKDSAAGGK